MVVTSYLSEVSLAAEGCFGLERTIPGCALLPVREYTLKASDLSISCFNSVGYDNIGEWLVAVVYDAVTQLGLTAGKLNTLILGVCIVTGSVGFADLEACARHESTDVA